MLDVLDEFKRMNGRDINHHRPFRRVICNAKCMRLERLLELEFNVLQSLSLFSLMKNKGMKATNGGKAADGPVIRSNRRADGLNIRSESELPNVLESSRLSVISTIEETNPPADVELILNNQEIESRRGISSSVWNENLRWSIDHQLVESADVGLTVIDLAQSSFTCIKIDEREANCGRNTTGFSHSAYDLLGLDASYRRSTSSRTSSGRSTSASTGSRTGCGSRVFLVRACWIRCASRD